MTTKVQYIVDNLGNKISVVISYSDWEKLNLQYQKLLNKLDILEGIKDSILEIRKSRKEGKKLQTLTDFLNKSRS